VVAIKPNPEINKKYMANLAAAMPPQFDAPNGASEQISH